jgi:hypothetical protein
LSENKEVFITIFDFNFLPQGLLLYESLLNHSLNFTLWVCCLDDKVYAHLLKLNLKNIKIFKSSDLENERLLEVKKNRTSGEYAWTLTPFLPSHIFSLDKNVDRITYLDADIWFLKDPQIILESFNRSNKSILLTPHDFQSNQNLSKDVGKFCVQFLTVTKSAKPFLEWWQELCIEWCYAVIEPNRFGDQKYLDLVPSKFPDLFYELEDTYLTQGPWNLNKFYIKDAVFYHFHGLRIKENRILVYSVKKIKKTLIKQVYQPYINQIRIVMQKYSVEKNLFQTYLPVRLSEAKSVRNKVNFIYVYLIFKKYRTFHL